MDNLDRYEGDELGEDGEFEESDTVGDPLLNDEE